MGEIAEYGHGEPPPVANSGPSMHDLVIMDMYAIDEMDFPVYVDTKAGAMLVVGLMEDRKGFGIRKYGTVLQANNGRNPLNDILDELGDALVYYKQWMEETDYQAHAYLMVDYKKLVALTMSVLITKKRIESLKKAEKEDPIDDDPNLA